MMNAIKPVLKLPSDRLIFSLISLLLVFVLFFTPGGTRAQDLEIEIPYYFVKEGDTLWEIANRFGVPLEELQTQNDLNDPNDLTIGLHLLIPGLIGISGQIDALPLNYGDTLQSLSRKYRLTEEHLILINRLTSPTELRAGSSVIVPIGNENNVSFRRNSLAPGQSLLELAVQNGENPWKLMLDNLVWNSWSAIPGVSFQTRTQLTGTENITPGGLPVDIEQIQTTQFPIAQGKTMMIKVWLSSGLMINGSIADRKLNFFPQGDSYVALQGIYTLTEPGPYPLVLEGYLGDSLEFSFSQSILVERTEYIYDPMLLVSPETVDPAVTEPENELWDSLGAQVTPEKMWDGIFTSPVPLELVNCRTSLFGNRRAYNGSAYVYFHSGLDFCGRIGTELFAPAVGQVVFTDSLIVRGNVVVVDHGWGVYSAYDHLSEILVSLGDIVQPGQTIGLGGETGRTTGPHLHWEVWVGGVQVDPADWLAQAFP